VHPDQYTHKQQPSQAEIEAEILNLEQGHLLAAIPPAGESINWMLENSDEAFAVMQAAQIACPSGAPPEFCMPHMPAGRAGPLAFIANLGWPVFIMTIFVLLVPLIIVLWLVDRYARSRRAAKGGQASE
jgi:hypothetical protein